MRTLGWFSTLVTANLIGIGANFDNCGVGIAYGGDKIRFAHWVNAIVNVIGFSTALLGAYAGTLISNYVKPSVAGWMACIVLVGIGLFFWYSAYVHPRVARNKERIKVQRPGWKQGIGLGFALSFTNVAIGFGSTVANAATIWETALSIAAWGYLMIWLGNRVGIGVLAKLLGNYSSFVAGLLLVAVGLHQAL